MAKSKPSIPRVLATGPVSLRRPFCEAKPGQDRATTSGGFSAVHIQRIAAAAKITKAKGSKRTPVAA
jgi:hypothetical protein